MLCVVIDRLLEALCLSAAWPDVGIKEAIFYKKVAQKVPTTVLCFHFSLISQKYYGYFCKKIWHQDISLCLSGHGLNSDTNYNAKNIWLLNRTWLNRHESDGMFFSCSELTAITSLSVAVSVNSGWRKNWANLTGK